MLPEVRSDILATIDGAIEDWQVSGDAMRWTPEAPEPAPALSAAETPAWRRFQANDLGGRQMAVHRAALAYGTAYATALPGVEGFTDALGTALTRSAEVFREHADVVQTVLDDTQAAIKPLPDRPAYVSPYGPPPRRRR